jgi:hypothetical protein
MLKMNDDNVIETTAIAISNNSLTIVKKDLETLADKRALLKEFVRNQLIKDVDYGLIPGCGDKPTLFQPGAEKLGMLFGLRGEFDLVFKEIDRENNFAMFSYKCSIIHISSGKKISECEAICNSNEKKYLEKSWWEKQEGGPAIKRTVPVNMVDIINTISKMSQKRAYVGGMVKATGASDFFTQDVDDNGDAVQLGMKPEMNKTESGALVFFAEGDTMKNKDSLKKLGGRWDASSSRWKFTNASANTKEKVAALAGIKLVDA